MRLHYFQHVPFEGLDRIEHWVKARGHQVGVTRFFAHDTLPDVNDYDSLVIMGGPMGAYEDAEYPWMKGEKHAIGTAIAEGKRVLGVCLGAQLIASVLGARVYPNTQKEIGWWPVTFAPEAQKTPLAVFGSQAVMYHWHGDTFDLPVHATLLASSAATPHQAFSFRENVIGLQFHPETSPETIDRWVQESDSVKTPVGFVMGYEEMKRQSALHLPTLEKTLFSFLDRFLLAA